MHAWLDSAQLKEEEGGVAKLGVSLPLRRPLNINHKRQTREGEGGREEGDAKHNHSFYNLHQDQKHQSVENTGP